MSIKFNLYIFKIDYCSGKEDFLLPACWRPSCSYFPYISLEKENGMNWDQVEGKWEQVKGKVKEKWGKLTDDDLMRIKGKRDQLSGKLQERYGYAKDRAEREIDEWSTRTNY